MSAFVNSADLYDAFYADKDYRGELVFVLEQLKKANGNPKTVLELGCGTGAYTKYLVDAGYTVTGLDSSKTMLDHARLKLGDKATFIQGDLKTFQSETRFDAIIALFHVFSYLHDQADLCTALANACENLRPGGLLFFDHWNGPGVLAEEPECRSKTAWVSGEKWRRTSTPEHIPSKQQVNVKLSFYAPGGSEPVLHETHRMRYFFNENVVDAARDVGTEIVNTSAWMLDQAPDESAWTAWALMRKP